MAILGNIKQTHVIEAISAFDEGITHPYGAAKKYVLHYEGRQYPPKAILGIAGKFAIGRFLRKKGDPGGREFSGGEGSDGANPYLRRLGFIVTEIGGRPPSESPMRESRRMESSRGDRSATVGDVLEDVLCTGLKIVFCGTRAGTTSASRGFYYSGPGNQFWRILAATKLTPILQPEEYRRLPEFGIGLTDLAKRSSGGDSGIRRSDFDVGGFRKKVTKFAPALVAFNGKRAAEEVFGVRQIEYGPAKYHIGASHCWVLPSTSGAARGHWDEGVWFALAGEAGRGAH